MRQLRHKLVQLARRAPWWGLSFLVHGIAIWILMHWHVAARPVEDVFEAVRIANLREAELPKKPLDIAPHAAPELPAIEPPLPRDELPPVVDKAATDELGKQGTTAVLAVEGGAFANRTPGGRAAAVKGGGGATEGSENAVELGLLWLARKQSSTGGWVAAHEGARWAEPGLSGLATLAFLGAGYTHKSGTFARTVRRALAYLKDRQDREGCIALAEGGRRGGGYMYCHAIATLALAEAYAMTKDPLLREPAERAVDFICSTQNATGGWRYYYNSPDGDSSVSGWMVMALRSASLAGLVVPPRVFDNARRFFDSVTDKAAGKTYYMRVTADAGDGKVGVLPMGLALNAVGLLAHQYLGLPGDDPYIDKASAVILETPPKWAEKSDNIALPLDKLALFTSTNNYYFWYYANLALHQRPGPAWDKWHPQVRDLLLKTMDRDGDKEGSWPPLTYAGSTGGRVYTTALAILTLEAYYRYAPMYREAVDEVLAAYGDALAAYNHFARMSDQKSPEAQDARRAALERIKKFLALADARSDTKAPKQAAERRGQAALMLVRLHRAGDEFAEAIALLKTFPERYPDLVEPTELVRSLAELHQALAQHAADAGDAVMARQAKAIALNLYSAIIAKARGKNPALELWLAAGFFERGDWQKAFELYKPFVEGIDLRRLDPKSEKGQTVLAVLDRLIQCCGQLKMYKTASGYLEQLEKLVGPNLGIQRQRADLARLREDYPAARRIYEGILAPGRVPEYGKDWWQAKYDQLFMAYLEGQGDFVFREISKLRITHPELGGDELLPRFLDLLGRAGGAKPPAKALLNDAG